MPVRILAAHKGRESPPLTGWALHLGRMEKVDNPPGVLLPRRPRDCTRTLRGLYQPGPSRDTLSLLGGHTT
jgi:hypothetical protein